MRYNDLLIKAYVGLSVPLLRTRRTHSSYYMNHTVDESFDQIMHNSLTYLLIMYIRHFKWIPPPLSLFLLLLQLSIYFKVLFISCLARSDFLAHFNACLTWCIYILFVIKANIMCWVRVMFVCSDVCLFYRLCFISLLSP